MCSILNPKHSREIAESRNIFSILCDFLFWDNFSFIFVFVQYRFAATIGADIYIYILGRVVVRGDLHAS